MSIQQQREKGRPVIVFFYGQQSISAPDQGSRVQLLLFVSPANLFAPLPRFAHAGFTSHEKNMSRPVMFRIISTGFLLNLTSRTSVDITYSHSLWFRTKSRRASILHSFGCIFVLYCDLSTSTNLNVSVSICLTPVSSSRGFPAGGENRTTL
ncbi:hypothetical protein Pelo_15110 [Pelomyxa schiedti]|nr:hypothetical protein Pelo_15110 [Pelomyxa schiedti]